MNPGIWHLGGQLQKMCRFAWELDYGNSGIRTMTPIYWWCLRRDFMMPNSCQGKATRVRLSEQYIEALSASLGYRVRKLVENTSRLQEVPDDEVIPVCIHPTSSWISLRPLADWLSRKALENSTPRQHWFWKRRQIRISIVECSMSSSAKAIWKPWAISGHMHCK